jgi:hypothetical protein
MLGSGFKGCILLGAAARSGMGRCSAQRAAGARSSSFPSPLLDRWILLFVHEINIMVVIINAKRTHRPHFPQFHLPQRQIRPR